MVEMGLRLALAGVLAAAVVAKLARPRAALDGLAAFGFRAPSAARAGLAALVLVEAGLAVGVAAGSDEAAWLGAALMALFGLALAGAIAGGRAGEPCACFGARSRIGWPAVARNAVLAAGFVAVALLPSDELSTEQWLGLGLIGAFAAVAALAAAVLALAREVGLLRLRVGPTSALEIPSEGPELGSQSDVIRRIPPKPSAELWLAVFTSEGCAVCAALGPAIDSVASHPAVAVGRFDEVADSDVWLELNVPGSPFAVALDADGTVLAKGTFNNLAQLESVLAAGERRRAEAVASG
ncbi:MAG TPA: MauE/DoxX family redox-associated membrane protein [Solirubrobacterales bacterium]|jgi:hypothetical protein